MFTADEVTDIVKRRLKQVKGGMPDTVQHELFLALLQRVDELEHRLTTLEGKKR